MNKIASTKIREKAALISCPHFCLFLQTGFLNTSAHTEVAVSLSLSLSPANSDRSVDYFARFDFVVRTNGIMSASASGRPLNLQ